MAIDERIGRALNSSNLKNDEHHVDVDIVGALAFTSQLGASLHQYFTAGHSAEYWSTVRHLSGTLSRVCRRKRLGLSQADSTIVARQALLEWDLRNCRACNGTGVRLLSYAAPNEESALPAESQLPPAGGSVRVVKVGDEQSQDSDRQRVDSCSHCDGTGLFNPLWSWRAGRMEVPESGDGEEEWWGKRLDLAKEIIEASMRAASRKVAAQVR